MQTQIIAPTTLLDDDRIRRASVTYLRPTLFLREKIETIKHVRLQSPHRVSPPVATDFAVGVVVGDSTLLNIVEVDEWDDEKRSPSRLAWMVRPGHWTFWGLTPRDRVTLGLCFDASLRLFNRSAAELAIVLGELIGIKLLKRDSHHQLEFRIRTLLDATRRITPSGDLEVNFTEFWCLRCFQALRALQHVGVISQLKLPVLPPMQAHPASASLNHLWLDLRISLRKPNSPP